jgi:hypothetical protein
MATHYTVRRRRTVQYNTITPPILSTSLPLRPQLRLTAWNYVTKYSACITSGNLSLAEAAPTADAHGSQVEVRHGWSAKQPQHVGDAEPDCSLACLSGKGAEAEGMHAEASSCAGRNQLCRRSQHLKEGSGSVVHIWCSARHHKPGSQLVLRLDVHSRRTGVYATDRRDFCTAGTDASSGMLAAAAVRGHAC